MKTFTNQIDLTAYWEGLSLTAYKDIAGIWTIGYGTTHIVVAANMVTIHEGMTCTKYEAMQWLRQEWRSLSFSCHWRLGFISGFKLDAITDCAYNVGLNAFPNLCKKLLSEDFQGAALEFLDGIYYKDPITRIEKPSMGLLLRRISEYHTFTMGEYVAFEKGDPISSQLKDDLLKMNARNQEAITMINSLITNQGENNANG